MNWWNRYFSKHEVKPPVRRQKPRKRSVDVNWGLAGKNPQGKYGGSGEIGDIFDIYAALRIERNNLNKNALLYRELRAMRSVSRYLTKNSTHAKNIINIVREGVLSGKADLPSFNKIVPEDLQNRVANAWEMYWESAAPFRDSVECGVDVERNLLGSVVEDGDALVRFMNTSGRMEMMHYTADMFYEFEPGTRQGDGANFMGVIYDTHGCPTAYDMLDRAEMVNFLWNGGSTVKRVIYPGEHCLHLKMATAAHEYRGVPYITQAIYNMIATRAFDNNTTAAMVLMAKLIGWVESTAEANSNYGDSARDDSVPSGAREDGGDLYDDGDGIDVPVEDDDPNKAEYRREAQQLAESLGINSVAIMQHGQEFKVNNPVMPTPAIQGFRESLIQELASATGFSTSAITKDFARGNFSGARQGLINDVEKHKRHFYWWTRTFRTPIYRRWLWQYMADSGLMTQVKPHLLEYLQNPKWKLPVTPWIDPRSESLAIKAQLETGFRSPRDVIEEMGYDYDEVVEEIKAHQMHLKEADMSMGDLNAAMQDEGDGKNPNNEDQAGENE